MQNGDVFAFDHFTNRGVAEVRDRRPLQPEAAPDAGIRRPDAQTLFSAAHIPFENADLTLHVDQTRQTICLNYHCVSPLI